MSNQLTGIRAERGYSYAEIEDVAQDVRRQLKLHPTSALDIHEFFEFHLDDITVGFGGESIPLVSHVEELKTEALTRWDPDSRRIQISLSDDTYFMLCRGHRRPRYTIAHELGHALLHTGQLMKLAELTVESQAALHRGSTDHKPFLDTEWQANAFAGAFIVPARGIKSISQRFGRIATADEIAAEYEISTKVADIRLDIYTRGKTGVR